LIIRFNSLINIVIESIQSNWNVLCNWITYRSIEITSRNFNAEFSVNYTPQSISLIIKTVNINFSNLHWNKNNQLKYLT